MRKLTQRAAALAAALGLVGATASGAWALTVNQPSSNPFTVAGDVAGNPQPFTITASGFSPFEAVFVQECDGVSPTIPNYHPSEHCDIASGNSPVNADDGGTATFDAADNSHRLNVFKGESPQSLFNCLSPTDPALTGTNGLPDFRDCQVRVSGGTPGETSEQAFLSIVLPNAPAATTTTTTVPATTTPAGDCSGSLSVGTVTPGLTDTTQAETLSLKLTKNLLTKVANGGSCAGFVKFPITAGPSGTEAVTKQAAKLSGAASCSTTSTGPGVDPGDPAAATAYALNGKLTLATATQATSAYVSLVGLHGDVADVAGMAIKGSSIGARLNGSLWQDPAVKMLKTDSGYPGIGGSGYTVDPNALVTLFGCADGAPGTVTAPGVTTVLVGDGTSPLLGGSAGGLHFTFGE